MTGLVLAGGQARRMGGDKATLVVEGRRLIDRAIEVLQSVCGEVVVAARDRPLEGLDVSVLQDAQGEGPLAGIVAGLCWAKTPLVAVLAVDMPRASAAVFDRLAAAHRDEPAVAPRAGGVVQPLHAVYATAAAGRFAALLASGERSPQAALQRLGALVLEPADYDPDGDAGQFWANVNSPADLRRLTAPHEPG